METREWILKRNCSIAPRQLVWVFAILCTVSLTVALGFTLRGAWIILVFSCIELMAVGAAMLVYARHATDREVLVLADHGLEVEVILGSRSHRSSLQLHGMRIAFPVGRQSLVALESRGRRVEIGRFMSLWQRRAFVQELQQELAARGGGMAAPSFL